MLRAPVRTGTMSHLTRAKLKPFEIPSSQRHMGIEKEGNEEWKRFVRRWWSSRYGINWLLLISHCSAQIIGGLYNQYFQFEWSLSRAAFWLAEGPTAHFFCMRSAAITWVHRLNTSHSLLILMFSQHPGTKPNPEVLNKTQHASPVWSWTRGTALKSLPNLWHPRCQDHH